MNTLLLSDVILVGDVVEHTNSHRRGCILEVGRTHQDGTTEYRVRPARDTSLDSDPVWWNSEHLHRSPRRDPFRRYLALLAIEDDPIKKKRRRQPEEGHPRWARRSRTFGPWLPDAVWDKMFWRLTNLRRFDPSGAYVHYDLGRSAWESAALECLARRDRAARWWHAPSISTGAES